MVRSKTQSDDSLPVGRAQVEPRKMTANFRENMADFVLPSGFPGEKAVRAWPPGIGPGRMLRAKPEVVGG